jgi:hypothetical protein
MSGLLGNRYPCPYCPLTAASPSALSRHINAEHKEIESVTLPATLLLSITEGQPGNLYDGRGEGVDGGTDPYYYTLGDDAGNGTIARQQTYRLNYLLQTDPFHFNTTHPAHTNSTHSTAPSSILPLIDVICTPFPVLASDEDIPPFLVCDR